MLALPLRSWVPLLLLPLTISVLHADVTLRYKTEVKMNPAMPAMMQDAMKGMGSAVAQQNVIRLKGGRGFSTSVGYDSITDFMTKEIVFMDTTTKRYAKVKTDDVAAEMARAIPAIPADGRAAMSSIKAEVTPARLTGRTAVIQGVNAEERELVFSVTGPAMPNVPPGPMIKMVLQFWIATPGEDMRVAAIHELNGYSVWSYSHMNPANMIGTMMKQMPGFPEDIESMMREMQKGTLLRMHMDVFMPAMTAMLQRTDLDPNSPFLQMDKEVTEISSAPVPDEVFQIPDGYQQAEAAELFKGMFAKAQATRQ